MMTSDLRSGGIPSPQLSRPLHERLWATLERLNLTDYYSPELQFLDISSRPSEVSQIFKELNADLLPQLNALMLSTNQLLELPSELLELTNLNMLFLAENRLRTIEGLERLRNLKTLNLDSNDLQELPERLTQLSALRCLYVQSNRLQALPHAIGQLATLEVLFAADNVITSLPDSLALCRLEGVNLKNNQLTEFPEVLTRIPTLKRIYLSNNRISNLPESIGNLTNLELLDLSRNNIKTLPATLGKLNRLEILDLSNNSIDKVPEDVRGCVALERLYLNGNLLSDVPRAVSSLRNLKALGMAGNKLRFVAMATLAMSHDCKAIFTSNPFMSQQEVEDLYPPPTAISPVSLLDQATNYAHDHMDVDELSKILPHDLVDRITDAVPCDVCASHCFYDTRLDTVAMVTVRHATILPRALPARFTVCSTACARRAQHSHPL